MRKAEEPGACISDFILSEVPYELLRSGSEKFHTEYHLCGSDEAAAEFGAVPSYEGARIGDPYAPTAAPAPAPTLEEWITKLEQAIERGLSL